MATLYQNIAQLKANVYSLDVGLDIASSFLPDEEVMVNLLVFKNLKMTEEQARLIVGQLQGLTQSANQTIAGLTASVNQTIAGLTASVNQAVAGLTASFQDTKQDLKEFAEVYGIYPVSKSNPLFEEVKKIKDDIRKSVRTMAKEQKALVKDFTTFVIETTNSVAGASILIAPLSFNIPGAIYLIITVIKSMNRIIDRFADLILHIEPLNLLFLVLPKDFFDTITAPINLIITGLNSLYTPVTAIKKLVDKLISFIIGAVKKNKEKTLKKLKREKKRKERKLKKENDPEEKADLEIEIDDLDKRISDLTGNKIQKSLQALTLLNEPPESVDVTSLLSNIDFSDLDPDVEFPELKGILSEIQQTVEVVETYVYDVYLPDGRIISGLDETKLEDIKNTYQVEFRN